MQDASASQRGSISGSTGSNIHLPQCTESRANLQKCFTPVVQQPQPTNNDLLYPQSNYNYPTPNLPVSQPQQYLQPQQNIQCANAASSCQHTVVPQQQYQRTNSPHFNNQTNMQPNNLIPQCVPNVSIPPPPGTQHVNWNGQALNNQVPPGNRANNYWDNFRR